MTMAMTRPMAIRDLSTYASDSEDRIALIDSEGKIVAVNDKWWSLAQETGAAMHRVGPGSDYLNVCQRASSSCPEALKALNGINAVLKGKLRSFTMDYSGETPTQTRHFRMGVTPIHYRYARLIVTHTDITELRKSKDENLERLQGFARRLIHAQEEERERIAREIHDDLGNRIALLSFSVRRIADQGARGSASQIDELNHVIQNITDLSNALRNLSHYLHPPLLKHAGICAALKALCEEFERTHRVRMDIAIPDELPHLSEEIGLCIFRVSQECLHNIAKHASAPRVSVVLARRPRELRLKVSDTGLGFVPSVDSAKGGLGLVSMKERVLGIRGRLEIQSAPGAGTQVSVTIPLPQRRSNEG